VQREHGGLNGTEDTGYDDSLMDAYIGRGESQGVMLENELSLEDQQMLGAMIREHRETLLAASLRSE